MGERIYGVHAPSHNLTFIIEESVGQVSGETMLQVRGFYAGEPDEANNNKFYGDMTLWIGGE